MALVKTILNGNEVEYDDKEFKLKQDERGNDFLHYIGNGKNIRNPKGNISCNNMFTGYSGTELDLSNFSTKNVVDMSNMFRECDNLQKLDLSNFDTSLVSSMSHMFCECFSLREVNLSSFNTEKVESTDSMFFGCEGLQKLDLHNFDLHCIHYMGGMFEGCCNLKELILPTFVNLIYIKCMAEMFYLCGSLEKLDMSGFVNLEAFKKGDIVNDYIHIYWECMFDYCCNLKYVYVTDEFLKVFNKIKDYGHDLSFKECGDIKFINKKDMYEDIKNSYNDKDVYKSYKNAYNIPDDDLMNILAEVKPSSPMITLFSKKVLIPQIQGMLDIKNGISSLTIGEVAKRLYNRYNKVIVDSALVLYLGDQYIVE